MGNLHISLIQTDLFWEDKFRNLEMLEKKIAAVEAATQIVVLPEMFTTGFSMQPKLFAETMDGPTVEWMVEQAAMHPDFLSSKHKSAVKLFSKRMFVHQLTTKPLRISSRATSRMRAGGAASSTK